MTNPSRGHESSGLDRLTGFAVLTVDWSETRKSYVDNFVDFVIYSMRISDNSTLTLSQIRKALDDTFQILLPEKVLGQILKKGVSLKLLVRSQDGLFAITQIGINNATEAQKSLKELSAEQVTLIWRFIAWVEKEFSLTMSKEDAEGALIDYVDTFYGTLISTQIGSGAISVPIRTDPSDMQRRSAAFVKWASEDDPESFSFLVNVAKGRMLVGALFTPKLVELEKRFKDTKIILDTKILFRALGYEGEEAQRATLEYVNLLVKQGAQVGAFTFTLDEAKGVLRHAATSARSGKIWESRPGTVGASYFKEGVSSGQIDLDIVQLQNHLQALNIQAFESPSYDEKYVAAELEIERNLKVKNPAYREGALAHDLRAVTAILRIRGGRGRDSFEECRAVFVTLNAPLLSAVREDQDLKSELWFVAMHETEVATLAWIKAPLEAPNLPKELLLASCLAVLRPSESRWQRYVIVIEEMQTQNEISNEDLLLLRGHYEKESLIASGMQNGATHEVKRSIKQVIKEIKAEVSAAAEDPFKALLAEASTREESLRAQVRLANNRAEEEKAARASWESSLRTSCRRKKDLVRIGVNVFFGISVIVLVALPGVVGSYLVVKLVTGAVAMLAIYYGGLSSVGKNLGMKFENWLLKRKGIQFISEKL